MDKSIPIPNKNIHDNKNKRMQTNMNTYARTLHTDMCTHITVHRQMNDTSHYAASRKATLRYTALLREDETKRNGFVLLEG